MSNDRKILTLTPDQHESLIGDSDPAAGNRRTHRPARRTCVRAVIHAPGLDIEVNPGQEFRLYGESVVQAAAGPDALWAAWVDPDFEPRRIRFAGEDKVMDVALGSASVQFDFAPAPE